jgi:hypothetical protein
MWRFVDTIIYANIVHFPALVISAPHGSLSKYVLLQFSCRNVNCLAACLGAFEWIMRTKVWACCVAPYSLAIIDAALVDYGVEKKVLDGEIGAIRVTVA